MVRPQRGGFKGKFSGKKHSSNGNKKNIKKRHQSNRGGKSQNKHYSRFITKTQNQEAEERLKQHRLKELEKRCSSSESEEEVQDPVALLLATFGNAERTQKPRAIESDTDESDSDDHSINNDTKDMDINDENDLNASDMSDDHDEDDNSLSDNDSMSDDIDIEIEGDHDNDNMEDIDEDGSVYSSKNNSDNESLNESDQNISNGSNKNNNKAISSQKLITSEVIASDDELEIGNEDPPLAKSDQFCVHLDYELNPDLLNVISTKPIKVKSSELLWPTIGVLHVDIPTKEINIVEKSVKTLDGDVSYAEEGKVPEKFNCHKIDWEKLGVKQQLRPHVITANEKNLQKYDNKYEVITPLQSELFSLMNGYQDLYYPERTLNNGEEVRLMYCLHVMNHVLKTRTKILHHNSKILQQKGEVPDYFRDQGLVRPRVLIVVPFRDSALRVVRALTSLLVPGGGGRVQNTIRLEQEYGGNTIAFPKRNPKPEDYEQLFAGNTDDTFRLGIAITKKSIKLYADYYGSDIIISSPLGLRLAVGAPGEAHRDYDFLSSVELMILDQADVFLAQNWDHVLHVMDHMHLQPKESHDTDFARVRMWSLHGHARFYRQTLLFSSHDAPQFRALSRPGGRCCNYRGSVRVANPIRGGAIREVAVTLPQVFHRITSDSATQAIEARFNYFTRKVLPQYRGPAMAQCLLYIPDYFDFVRLRNYFKREEINFTQICEYSKDSKVARARDMFFHGAAPIMLYSERAHYFRRSRIRGIRHLLMYQPPVWAHFYSEMCNLMQEANQNPRTGVDSNMTVTVLFTKYDMLQIAGIVGTERAAQLAHSKKDVHMFMTGD